MAGGYDELSATLRSLRKDAGLSTHQAARQSGFSQSKISRFETGRLMPTADEIGTLCRVYRASAATRKSLSRVARDIRAESTSGRVILQRGGAWRMQYRIARIEAASARVRGFDPAIVIGLLQTRAYIRAMWDSDAISGDDLERFVEARISRQELLNTNREFTLIMTEGALRFNLGGSSAMIDQLNYLAEATHISNAHVGVISQFTPAATPAMHSFHVYDARAVLVGTLDRTGIITEPRDVADFEKHFAELEALASFGARARDVIARAARDFA